MIDVTMKSIKGILFFFTIQIKIQIQSAISKNVFPTHTILFYILLKNNNKALLEFMQNRYFIR